MALTRLEAQANGISRYVGKVCAKHPNLQGLRYVASYGCISCALDAVKKNQAKDPGIVQARSKQYREQNKAKVRQRHQEWREANVAHDAARKQAYRAANLEKVKLAYKQYYKANYPRMLAKRNKQHADKLQRTPSWLTADEHWMIEQAYELAAMRTARFGFPWHVDHVIPLRGTLASGLHTPYNLQVIPAVDNLRKSNRMEFA